MPLRSVTMSGSGERIAVANNLGRVYVWSAAEGLDMGFVPVSKLQAHKGYITRCLFSPSGEHLATAAADHTVGLWEFADSQRGGASVDSGASNTDDRWSNISDADDHEDDGSDSGIEKLILRHSLEGHLKWVWDCAFSADSAYLVSASSDNTARLWSASSGDCISIFTGHLKALTSVTLNDLAL